MKAHIQDFKENIKLFGRELSSKVTYTLGGQTIELGNENLNSVSPHYEGAILKSVMKQLDVDCDREIPEGTEINYQFGVKVRNMKNIFVPTLTADGSNINHPNSTVVLNNDEYSLTATGSDMYFGQVLAQGNTYTGTRGTLYEVSGATKIYLYCTNSTFDKNYITFYDTNKVSLGYNSINNSKTNGKTVPANAKYFSIRFGYGSAVSGTTYSTKVMVSREPITEYETYGATPYDYVNFGNYIVKNVEKSEDSNSWRMTCYDKMLYSMKDYEPIKSKNLFGLVDGSYYANGVTAVVSNGEITLNGTSNANAFINISIENTLDWIDSQAYSISLFNNATNSNVRLRINSSGAYDTQCDNVNQTRTITYDGRTGMQTTNILIRIQNGTTLTNFKLKPMLELGSTPSEYASYFKYPVTIKNYIKAICSQLNIDFQDSTFANQDKVIPNEMYLDSEGNSLGYTFRDVLDELAQVTASTICINEDNNKLEIRYISQAVGKNLFDKNNANILDGSYLDIGNGVITNNGANKTLYIPITGGKNYTVTKRVSDRFSIATTSVLPEAGVSLIDKIQDNSATNLTLFASRNAKYLCVHYYRTSDTLTPQQILDSIQIKEGSTATEYEPFGDTIDEEYLKDVNVAFGEPTKPINTIVLSRAAGSDKVYKCYPDDLPEDQRNAIEISENQIMNWDDRDTYLPDILNKLNGLSYYINDYSSTGITYYNLCDRYNVQIGENIYSCVMLNDEVNITQGLEENVYTEMPEEVETDYKKADTTDRRINQTTLTVNKLDGEVKGLATTTEANTGRITAAEALLTSQGAQINIMQTNINKDTGDIESVKTVKGYTFDDQGLEISSDEDEFSSLLSNTGAYYKVDGKTVSQITKDNTITKDMVLYGRYYYGVDVNLDVENFTKDDAMFVAEKYTDGNSEEGFGHFYNGLGG